MWSRFPNLPSFVEEDSAVQRPSHINIDSEMTIEPTGWGELSPTKNEGQFNSVDSGFQSTSIPLSGFDSTSVPIPRFESSRNVQEDLHADLERLMISGNSFHASQTTPATTTKTEDIGFSEQSEHSCKISEEQAHNIFNTDSDGDTQLHTAIIWLIPNVASKMIDIAMDYEYLNIQNKNWQTPLHLATITNQPDIVRKLLVSGGSLHLSDHSGNTALHIACREGFVECVTALTTPVRSEERQRICYHVPEQRIPQDLGVRNYEGYTCLHLASSAGHMSIVEYLIHLGADKNVQDGKSGRTILHNAVESENVQLIQYLLRFPGLSIDPETFDGCTPLRLAVGRGLMSVANILVQAGADKCGLESDSEDSDDSDDEIGTVYTDITVAGKPVFNSTVAGNKRHSNSNRIRRQ